MAEAQQYTVSLRDLVEMLIKENDIHEGGWIPQIEMQIGTGTFGPPQQEQRPGAFVTFSGFGIRRADPSSLPAQALVVEAATVNPVARKKKG